MNRSGWLRIIEASIAAVLVLGVLFFYIRPGEINPQDDLSERVRFVLNDISLNSSVRYEILTDNTVALNNTVASYFPERALSYEIRICEINAVCGKSTYTETNVYAGERIIGASVDYGIYEPKKIRLFVWRNS